MNATLNSIVLEYVEISMSRRKQENFVSGKANFAVGCGRSGEKFNDGLKQNFPFAARQWKSQHALRPPMILLNCFLPRQLFAAKSAD